MTDPLLSVVVPMYNEDKNIPPLLESLSQSLAGIAYEILLVDDGSTDNSAAVARRYANDNIRLIELARNYGQTAALAAGIDHARGRYIATLDGDMQNDPGEIGRMLSLLMSQPLDMVAGWRKDRKDSLLRCLPSAIINRMIRLAFGAPVHDSGCTLKVMTADMARKIEWHGQMHRFIPVLCHLAGGRVAEMEVKHNARLHGSSKYGPSRIFRVSRDIALLWLSQKFYKSVPKTSRKKNYELKP